ncbi:MAG: molybdenum transporter ATP-binding protein [Verrucomicrobiales bacterium]|nr:molybdenum transporter ATP-binding protein [Verrucomicrobiales bacterium]
MKLELEKIHLPLAPFTLGADAVLTGFPAGLSGPSGSGKTSLLEIIAGLRPAATGRVMLNGTVLSDSVLKIFVPPWLRKIGYVPQDHALFPHWTARRNLFATAHFTSAPADSDHARVVIDLLELEPLLTRLPHTLSGGEKSRLALARALMSRPELLLLDEPFAHLDDRLRDRAMDYLLTASRTFNLPLILVSHSATELRQLCQEVHFIDQGRLPPPS